MKNVPNRVIPTKNEFGFPSPPKYKPGRDVTSTSEVTLGLINLFQIEIYFNMIGYLEVSSGNSL